VPFSKPQQAALMRFGASIRRERTGRGITQEQLAEQTELHLRTIQKIEAGSINVLITTAQRIQKALNCRWERLMD
jgi:transcriptional regulator with XRE-family HTH domain